jgi:hypothetical protein
MKFAPHSSVEYSPGGFRQATDFRRVACLAAQRAAAKREYILPWNDRKAWQLSYWKPRLAAIRDDVPAGLCALLSLLIDQNRLLPSAWRLVGAVNATCPAAGPLLALQQLVTGSFNAALARCWLFRIVHPADELIPTERRQAFPQPKDFRIRLQCCLKVSTCFVDSAMGKRACHKTSMKCRPTIDFINAEVIACQLVGVLKCAIEGSAFGRKHDKYPNQLRPFAGPFGHNRRRWRHAAFWLPFRLRCSGLQNA